MLLPTEVKSCSEMDFTEGWHYCGRGGRSEDIHFAKSRDVVVLLMLLNGTYSKAVESHCVRCSLADMHQIWLQLNKGLRHHTVSRA